MGKFIGVGFETFFPAGGGEGLYMMYLDRCIPVWI